MLYFSGWCRLLRVPPLPLSLFSLFVPVLSPKLLPFEELLSSNLLLSNFRALRQFFNGFCDIRPVAVSIHDLNQFFTAFSCADKHIDAEVMGCFRGFHFRLHA